MAATGSRRQITCKFLTSVANCDMSRRHFHSAIALECRTAFNSVSFLPDYTSKRSTRPDIDYKIRAPLENINKAA